MLQKFSVKLIKTLLDFNENFEFVLRHAIKIMIDGSDWKEKYSGVIVISMICESKRDFLIAKKNYCKKVIESLVYGYKNTSEKIRRESCNILTKFIASLPNYAEITKTLPSEMINRIYQMQCEAQSKINNDVDKLISKSIDILNNPLLNVSKDEENSPNYTAKVCIDKDGNAFGIFPYSLIEAIESEKTDLEEKIEKVEEMYKIFEEKNRASNFLRYINYFFKFLTKFTMHSSISISQTALRMIDEMIKYISGVNLIASLNQILPSIINTLKSQNVQNRKISFDILTKIIMILPMSQVIPFVINAMSTTTDWILITECLNFTIYCFTHLNEIYNDIEWYGQNENFDINIFLEVLKLFDHNVAKVRVLSRKLIRLFGEQIYQDKDKFIKDLSYYINDALYNEIVRLFNNDPSSSAKNLFDVATRRSLSAFNSKFSVTLALANDVNNELIYDKVRKYEQMRGDGQELNADENLMKNLLDNQGRIIKFERPPVDNYPNYEIDPEEKKPMPKNKIMKSTYKSRLRRYNDPEVTFEDEKSDLKIKRRESLSPANMKREPLNRNFFNAVSVMKNKLNWEKQFKAIEFLRKVIQYNTVLLKSCGENYLASIVSELVELTSSSRSLLSKSALICLGELIEVENINLSNQYLEMCQAFIHKTTDKSPSIKEEAIRSMISLIMFSKIDKLSTCLITNFIKTKNNDIISILIMIFGFFLKYHQKKIFNLANWNKMMIFVTENFDINRRIRGIKDACLEFFIILKNFFLTEEKFENYLKSYFSLKSMNSLLFLLSTERPDE